MGNNKRDIDKQPLADQHKEADKWKNFFEFCFPYHANTDQHYSYEKDDYKLDEVPRNVRQYGKLCMNFGVAGQLPGKAGQKPVSYSENLDLPYCADAFGSNRSGELV